MTTDITPDNAVTSTRRPLIKSPWILFSIILFGALLLRIYGLGQESAWNDEALSLRFLDAPDYQSYAEPLFQNDRPIRHAPVYFALQYHWRALFGPSLYSARMLSIFFFALSMGFFFLIARRLYDDATALWALAFYAASLPHIYFAQEVRFYSLVTLFATISIYTFVRADQDRSRLWWCIHLALNAVLLCTHTMGVLLWLAEGSFLLLFRRRQWQLLLFWFTTHFACVGLFALWVTQINYDFDPAWFEDRTPTYREFLNAFAVYAGGRFSNYDPAEYLPTGFSFDFILAVGAGLAFLWLTATTLRETVAHRAWQQTTPPKQLESDALCLMWCMIPPLFLFLLSQIWHPTFFYRYTLYSSLGLYLLMGSAIVRLIPRRYYWTAALAVLLIYSHQWLALQGTFRPDYRSALAHIQTAGTPDDTLLSFKPLNGVAVEYEMKNSDLKRHTIEGLGELLDAIDNEAQTVPNVWAVVWLWEDAEGFEEELNKRGLEHVRETFGGVPPLYLYRVTR